MSNLTINLKNKVVLITGGAGIQGPEHAKAFKAYGAKVILTDINQKKLKAICTSLKLDGFYLDVTDKNSVEEGVKRVVNRYGRIDVLVNNAGGINNQDLSRKKGFEKQTIDDWAKVLKLNLTGVFLCCQAVGKQMVKQKKGSIINVSSIYGLVAPDFRIYSQKTAGRGLGTPAAYSAAKAGVIGLTKYLASYYGDKNVRVNCVTPGGIYDNQDKQFVKKYTLRVPLGRMAEKDEVTGAIIYLASDLASYVTGENIIVDGGLTVW